MVTQRAKLVIRVKGKEVWAPRQKGNMIMGPPNPSSSPLGLYFSLGTTSVSAYSSPIYPSGFINIPLY